jgi:hypothetical protein
MHIATLAVLRHGQEADGGTLVRTAGRQRRRSAGVVLEVERHRRVDDVVIELLVEGRHADVALLAEVLLIRQVERAGLVRLQLRIAGKAG